MVSIPSIAYPFTLPAGGPHLRITYTDASTANVSVAASPAGGYFIQGDNASTCLLQAVEDALVSAAAISTASVTIHSFFTGRVSITVTGTKTIDIVTFLTADLYPMDLGYALSTASSVITFGAVPNICSAVYRPPSLWCPSAFEFSDLVTRTDAAVSQTASDGSGVDDIYTGHKTSAHSIPEVYGALVRDQIVSSSSHCANVAGLTTGDTNATLQGWLVGLGALLGGVRPSLRWTADIDALATYRSVRIGNAAMLGSVDGWTAATNPAPLSHDLEFGLIEV